MKANNMLNFQLDIQGVQCSGGSACSSGPWAVFKRIPLLPAAADFGSASTTEEVDRFIEILGYRKSIVSWFAPKTIGFVPRPNFPTNGRGVAVLIPLKPWSAVVVQSAHQSFVKRGRHQVVKDSG